MDDSGTDSLREISADADDALPYGDRRVASEPPTVPARAAIVHDWFQGFHGAERVVEVMRSELSGLGIPPDIFTFQAAKELLPESLAAAIVSQSRLATLPGIRQRGHRQGRWRYLLPYLPHYFSSLDVSGYDLVISSSHACAVNVRPESTATHLCYCYTPMRYAWIPETDGRGGGVRTAGLAAFRRHLRRVDLKASTRPDGYIAISSAVAERIRRFYGRDAEIIFPPVDVTDFDSTVPKDPDLFVWAHRLVGYKRPELVAEAFRGLPYRLVMVGVGPLEETLRKQLPPNVQLLGWLSREELAAVYARASGFIHIGEEDFGITMVEALASGAPVIAVNRGGARDIVRDGIDGILLDEPDLPSLRAAVRQAASTEWSRESLRLRASEFSREQFARRFREHVLEMLAR